MDGGDGMSAGAAAASGPAPFVLTVGSVEIDLGAAGVGGAGGIVVALLLVFLCNTKRGDKIRAHRANVNAATGGEQAKAARKPIATGAGKHCTDYSRFDAVVDSSDDEYEKKVGGTRPLNYNWNKGKKDDKGNWEHAPWKDPKAEPTPEEKHQETIYGKQIPGYDHGLGKGNFPVHNNRRVGRRPT